MFLVTSSQMLFSYLPLTYENSFVFIQSCLALKIIYNE